MHGQGWILGTGKGFLQTAASMCHSGEKSSTSLTALPLGGTSAGLGRHLLRWRSPENRPTGEMPDTTAHRHTH